MRISVLGAAGGSGRRVVEQALREGHHVTAAVRSPDRFPPLDIAPEHAGRLRVMRADVRDPDSLPTVTAGHDAVVVAIGPPGRRAMRLYSDGARAVVDTMQRCDVGRLIAITSAGVRDDDPELALWYRLLVRPLLRDIYSDMRLMEDTVRTSGLDWTLVRPVLLVDRDPTDTYRVRDDATPRRGRTITRTDLARFIVNEVDRPQWSRRTPTLAQ